ncbi:HAMP domain-containing sensor histidine kinase [Pontiellaceae bacterium B12219]|nr:HAMP domain-containing sensor histidine kinase [Pontiellaceae bacterium B12219]
MKKRTIRVRVFAWVATHTMLNFFLIALVLFCYDFYEYWMNHGNLDEELEEMLVVLIVMAILLPVSLGGAWAVSRRLLRPWRDLLLQAEHISNDRLDDRIAVVNQEDEIGRLAATLNQTFDRYQTLLDRMQRFNYDASHQLRNPLAAIRTSGEVCLKHDRSAAEYRSVIGGMLEDAGRLNRTVDQLLLLARTAGDLDECRKRVSINTIAEDVVREAQVIGELKGISVALSATEESMMAEVIPDLLREALANLLDNALKYSPEKGEILIRIMRPDSRVIRISVSDSGAGLTPGQKARIFRPFMRGTRKNGESVGLGLAIVADICRAHQARFGVDDNAGQDCCFWIELPG